MRLSLPGGTRMFRLHEKTRRRICRAAFVLLCLVPTAGVLGWCAKRHLPGVARTEARRLTRELGLNVSLGGLTYLRPGAVLYEGLELTDPETGKLVLRCRVLKADRRQTTDQQGRPKASLVLIAFEPEVEATAVDRLKELLERMLRRPTILGMVSGGSPAEVRLAADQLTLRAADGPQTLTELQGKVESFPGACQAEASFRLAGIDASQPIRIRVVRNRQTTPPLTGFELDTGGGAVPCGLLARGLPLLEELGPRSRLCGYLWAKHTGDGWDGQFAGQVLDVELDDLVTGHFPHKLSGLAQVTVQSARFHRQRLEEAMGTLVAGPGVISRSLIDAAVEQLGLVRGEEPQAAEPRGDPVPYEQLALALLIDSRGLQLQGRCAVPGTGRTVARGTILVGRQGRLLDGPTWQSRPAVALLRTLVPAHEVQVPATRQTDWLVGHLPLPRAVPPAGALIGLPQARLGWRREGPRSSAVTE
jgi:hypothetical protein